MIYGIGRQGADLTIAMDGQTGTDLPSFTRGELVQAKVVAVMPPAKAMLMINGRRVMAETAIPLSRGEVVSLQATGDGAFKLLPQADAPQASNGQRGLLPLLSSLSSEGPFGSLVKVITPLLNTPLLKSSGVVSDVTGKVMTESTDTAAAVKSDPLPPGQGASNGIAHLRDLLVSMSLSSGKADAAFLPRLIEKSGLLWEKSLARFLPGPGAMPPDTGQIRDLANQDLKGFAMMLSSRVKSETADALKAIEAFSGKLTRNVLTASDIRQMQSLLSRLTDMSPGTAGTGGSRGNDSSPPLRLEPIVSQILDQVRTVLTGREAAPPVMETSVGAAKQLVSILDRERSALSSVLKSFAGQMDAGPVPSEQAKGLAGVLNRFLPPAVSGAPVSGEPVPALASPLAGVLSKGSRQAVQAVLKALGPLMADDGHLSLQPEQKTVLDSGIRQLTALLENDTSAPLDLLNRMARGKPGISLSREQAGVLKAALEIPGQKPGKGLVLLTPGMDATAAAQEGKEIVGRIESALSRWIPGEPAPARVHQDLIEATVRLASFLEKEGTDTRGRLKEFVSTIESFQTLNTQTSESGRYLIPFPIFSASTFSFGQLFFELGKGKDDSREAPAKRLIKVSLLLTMTRLGDLRVDFSMLKSDISGRFLVADSDTAGFIRPLLPELVQRLNQQRFNVLHLDCQTAAPAVFSHTAFVETLTAGNSQGLNVVI